jgi:hypothetical protein
MKLRSQPYMDNVSNIILWYSCLQHNKKPKQDLDTKPKTQSKTSWTGTKKRQIHQFILEEYTNWQAQMAHTDVSDRPVRSFDTQFKEHVSSFRTSSNNSKFAQHLLDNGYGIGPMEDIMEVWHIINTCLCLNTLEKYCNYRETKKETQIYDKQTVNDICNALVQYDVLC